MKTCWPASEKLKNKIKKIKNKSINEKEKIEKRKKERKIRNLPTKEHLLRAV